MVHEKSGKPTTVLRADTDTISEAAIQRGEPITKVEPGDTRAISKPKNKNKKERKNHIRLLIQYATDVKNLIIDHLRQILGGK